MLIELSADQQAWVTLARDLATEVLAPRAAEVDKTTQYPRESMDALAAAGFYGLRALKKHGGAEADLLTTVLVVEELAKKCPSTAMCFKMHIEAAEMVCRIANPDQVERFVKPITEGKALFTVAGGETSGQTGKDWQPSGAFTAIKADAQGYQLDHIRKSYVTSAAEASHFFFMCKVGEDAPRGATTAMIIERDKIEWQADGEWNGLGMRGNGSTPVQFTGHVPNANRLGDEHEGGKNMGLIMMPVVALTYAAAYLGIGAGAYEIACEEATRQYPSGARRIDNPINKRRMAELGARLEAARSLLHLAAKAGDAGQVTKPIPYIQAKVMASEAAVAVTTELMTMFGGTAFAGRLPFERFFRDARAGMVMGLANDEAYPMLAGMQFPKPR
ncbi:MAG: acyl-CoA/acyl-ACP dehydrogenase [Pseudomonadales bacterium]|nr:acyl-CoA/acyl-ACP dehydrogenase [Pseudomonadales bacterium]